MRTSLPTLTFRIPVRRTGFYQPHVFEQKVPLFFERSKYVVKTIQTESELREVLKFRYEIFHREFQGKLLPFGMDWDSLDHSADHLVIIDKTLGKMIGTYRLISTSFSKDTYSNKEFDISDLLAGPEIKLELSRACIHRNYRNGIVIGLLWRGICQYLSAVQADYLMGCSSVNTMDSQEIGKILKSLAEQKVGLDSFTILPREKFFRKNGPHWINRKKVGALPALLQSYLNAGAKVSLHPAWDYEFHCVDFFTLLKVSDMAAQYRNRFK